MADTGEVGQTRVAVEDIASLNQKDPKNIGEKIKHLGNLADLARTAIEQKDAAALGKMMSQAHLTLSDLTVSNPTLDYLVEKSLVSGALGAKLTGGGRGGCMIALARTQTEAEKIARSLERAGAKNTWIHPLGADHSVS